MARFQPRVFTEIIGDMIQTLIASTPLTDINFGSVWTTMLEAAAQEDDEQYFQMLEIIRGYSLDTTTGEDLDNRATEYGLERSSAKKASSFVTISDSTVTKVTTQIYSGLPGSPAGSFGVNVDDVTGFPASGGDIIVGRGTPNAETVTYTSIDSFFPNYFTFNLSTGLANDHGTDESVVLSSGSSRFVPAGTVVFVPSGDLSPRIDFETDEDVTLLDGEEEVQNVPVTASEAGSDSNVPVGSITKFDSLPFAGANVRNTVRVTNGTDEETDQELRDRIKEFVQSLSRGTPRSIISNVLGLEAENKRVVSASLVEPSVPAGVVKLYIDDGTGFIPTFKSIGIETVIDSATGGEKFLNVDNFPIVKAFAKTRNSQPFNLSGGEDLFVEIGGRFETINFDSTNFEVVGSATAQEVVTRINSVAQTFEARLSDLGTTVRIFSRGDIQEQIRITGGTANSALNFPTELQYTTNLYLERDNETSLLSKDGTTAVIETTQAETYAFTTGVLGGSITERILTVVVDGGNPQTLRFPIAEFDDIEFGTNATVTAEEMVSKINEQASGFFAFLSSNETKVSLASRQERSINSKIRVLDSFSKVINEELVIVGSSVNRTDDAKNLTTSFPMFEQNGYRLHLGIEHIRFNSIWFNVAVQSSTDLNLSLEYWNGTGFTEIGFTDETNGLTQGGHIFFGVPSDWVQVGPGTMFGLPDFQGDNTPRYFVRIRRNTFSVPSPPSVRTIKICSANEILFFPETESVGTNNDYAINRFLGEIELTDPLKIGDKVTLGSVNTRASIISQASGNYNVGTNNELTIISGGITQSYTLQPSDYLDVNSVLASEIATVINREFVGIFADTVDLGTKVRITDKAYNNGTIEVDAQASNNLNDVVQFNPLEAESLTTHTPAIESRSIDLIDELIFNAGDNIVVVMDGNNARNYTVPCTYSSSLTSDMTFNTIFFDTSLNSVFPNAEDILGFDVIFTSGANDGERRQIQSYNPATGEVNVGALVLGLEGDTYEIAPRLATHVESFFNNSSITLLSNDAEISAINQDGGEKVQIASFKQGNDASVKVTGGTGNTQLQFSTIVVTGLDAYKHWTELIQETQWTVDGREDDEENYPGYRAAGVQVDVLEAVKIPLSVELSVTPTEGVTLATISGDVRSAVSNYIQNLGVGDDVVISQIIFAVKEITGVFDVKVVSPVENVAIADNELPRIEESKIIVG